jgi:hypothetical protein
MSTSEQSSKKYIQEYVGPCPYCGFHLQQPKINRCSECGNTLEITLKSPFKITAWFLMLVGLWSSIAIYLTHIVFLCIGAYSSGGKLMGRIVVPETLVLLSLVFLAFIWLYIYQWFSARSVVTKWITGTVGFLLPIILYQAMIWLIIR